MGRHARFLSPQAATRGVGAEPFGHHARRSRSLPIFAFTVALAFLGVLVFTPYQTPTAAAAFTLAPEKGQRLTVADGYAADATRDSYSVTRKVVAAAPASSVPAGEAQLIAYGMLQAMGMGDDQFSCLVSLWNRESHWSTTAGNASGAYGIPQALPGSKMASAGPDWQTNATTQITWGLHYITGRYSTPCAAWAHSEAMNWY